MRIDKDCNHSYVLIIITIVSGLFCSGEGKKKFHSSNYLSKISKANIYLNTRETRSKDRKFNERAEIVAQKYADKLRPII